MTKADVVAEVAKLTGVEKLAVQKAVECFMEVVKESMVKDKNVYLRGFGSFIVKRRAQKTARNISKNTTLVIPEHHVPAFKPAKTFVARVKESVKRSQ
jgi:DNA-binding protein HU-beta